MMMVLTGVGREWDGRVGRHQRSNGRMIMPADDTTQGKDVQ